MNSGLLYHLNMKSVSAYFFSGNKVNHTNIGLLFVATFFAGLIFSHALQSISMGLLVANAIINTDVKENLKKYFSDKLLMVLVLFLLTYLLSGFYSEDKSYWWERVNVRLAFVALPLGMITLRGISQQQFMLMLRVFLWMMFMSGCVVLTKYLLHFNEVNDMYSYGQTMDTPYSHVRFSLMVCFSVFTGWYLFTREKKFLFRYEKHLILIATLFLILLLHLLAVRSGLLGFYLCAIFLLARYIFLFRKWREGIVALMALILFPLLAFYYFPSVKTKVLYMKYDLEQYFLFNQVAGLSDATRIVSVKNGIEIGKENIWFGVGAGDVRDEAGKKYSGYPEIKTASKLPHNQLVWEFASVGLIGFAVFWFASLFVFFFRRNFYDPLFVCLHLLIFSSYLTEATADDSTGNGLYLVFLLLIYFHLKNKSE